MGTRSEPGRNAKATGQPNVIGVHYFIQLTCRELEKFLFGLQWQSVYNLPEVNDGLRFVRVTIVVVRRFFQFIEIKLLCCNL